MNELVEPPEHLISSDEQDPSTTPVTESPSTSTKKSSLKKMYLAKIKEFQNGTCKNDMKLKYLTTLATTLHDGQQQLGGVVFQLQNQIHFGISELKDSFSMRLPEIK
jgi:hypothetical protein